MSSNTFKAFDNHKLKLFLTFNNPNIKTFKSPNLKTQNKFNNPNLKIVIIFNNPNLKTSITSHIPNLKLDIYRIKKVAYKINDSYLTSSVHCPVASRWPASLRPRIHQRLFCSAYTRAFSRRIMCLERSDQIGPARSRSLCSIIIGSLKYM